MTSTMLLAHRIRLEPSVRQRGHVTRAAGTAWRVGDRAAALVAAHA